MDPNLVVYIPIAVLLGIGIFFALLLPILSVNLGPKRLQSRALAPYESGMTPIGEAQRRMPVKFYRIAVLFILFDVDIILLVPWAVTKFHPRCARCPRLAGSIDAFHLRAARHCRAGRHYLGGDGGRWLCLWPAIAVRGFSQLSEAQRS